MDNQSEVLNHLSQQVANIEKTQIQQMALIQRLTDLNTFIDDYDSLGTQLKSFQSVLLDAVVGVSIRLDSALEILNRDQRG